MANKFDDIMKKKVEKAMLTLPTVLANEAVNHSFEAFKNQAWEGKQWRRRIYTKGQGSTILIKSGRGRRGMRVVVVHSKGFIYGNDVPYMAAHNYGFSGSVKVKAFKRKTFGKGKVYDVNKFTKSGKRRSRTVSFETGDGNVKAHTRKLNLPQRQFAGKGASLVDRLSKKGKAHFIKIFNS